MQIGPELSRNVVVQTKLDTRIPQFARPSDVEVFLLPPTSTLDGCILGDLPFFTSVLSGRVGSGSHCLYSSNDDFKQAVSFKEMEDVASLEEKLGRPLSKQERNNLKIHRFYIYSKQNPKNEFARYINNVPLINSLLEKEHRSVTRKLSDVKQELSCHCLLKGTVVAPPDKFGETLSDERVNGGAFVGADGVQFPHKLIPNAGMRLYGGAQYHRAMAEFHFVVGGIKCTPITREEIVNACGVEDIHDGINYSR
ncbi:hypothetical protein RYX36_031764 [Vicia faba]